MTSKEDDRLIAAIPGLTAEVLRQARSQFGRTSVMQQVLQELAQQAIETERNALEACTAEDLPKIQGKIAGIKRMQGIIASQQP